MPIARRFKRMSAALFDKAYQCCERRAPLSSVKTPVGPQGVDNSRAGYSFAVKPVARRLVGAGGWAATGVSDAVANDATRNSVDASVMPTVIRGNTNAPVIAVAERAADLMRRSVEAQKR